MPPKRLFCDFSLLRFDHFLVLLKVPKRVTLFFETPLVCGFFSCNLFSLQSRTNLSLSQALSFDQDKLKDNLRTCGIV